MDAEYCVMCGSIIPEGRQVCIKCEVNISSLERKEYGKVSKMRKMPRRRYK